MFKWHGRFRDGWTECTQHRRKPFMMMNVRNHGGIREGATSGPTSNEPCASPTIYHLIVKSYQLLVKCIKCAILHCNRSAGKRKWLLRMRAVNLIFFIVQNN